MGILLTTQLLGVAVAAWLFKVALSPSSARIAVPIAGLLLGLGAGAGVTPALFMAGLSAPPNKLGPTFALVELLHSVGALRGRPAQFAAALRS